MRDYKRDWSKGLSGKGTVPMHAYGNITYEGLGEPMMIEVVNRIPLEA